MTPPTSARSQSPTSSAWQAWCTATNDELHAVSTHGRSLQAQPKLIRPAAAAAGSPCAGIDIDVLKAGMRDEHAAGIRASTVP